MERGKTVLSKNSELLSVTDFFSLCLYSVCLKSIKEGKVKKTVCQPYSDVCI